MVGDPVAWDDILENLYITPKNFFKPFFIDDPLVVLLLSVFWPLIGRRATRNSSIIK